MHRVRVESAESGATVTPPMFQMMDNDRNSWQHWQPRGDEEILQSPTTPHYSVRNSDWQTPGEESLQLLVHPDASWLPNDFEGHQCNALGAGPFESIENAIPITNWEFRNQFPEVDLNGNLNASPESWKNFPEADDGDVGVEAGPQKLGMCSRATQGPLTKRNQTTATSEGQNLKPRRNPRRNQIKIDGVKASKTGKRHRGRNWTPEETRSFLQHMEVQKGKSPWKAISDSLKAMAFVREANACEDHWGVLLADLKKFQKHFGSDNILRDLHFWPSVGTMSREQRSQNRLPLVFEEEWFELIAKIAKERSKPRNSGRESSESRIHVAEAPPSSSCRHQPRVSAASATPSSGVFDNVVGDGDAISGLVKLLGSTDRNVTVDQTIEVMKIGLEAQRMDLRRQELEFERDRMYMYQGQRNGLPENGRRPTN